MFGDQRVSREHFRDAGKQVLLLIDSVSRHAEAYRELRLTLGEPASFRGYPPSLAHRLMSLAERAGPGVDGTGDITAVFSVLVQGDDMQEPVADLLRGVLDGHTVLDRRIAEIAETMERADLIRAFQAFKGIKVLTAATIVAEVGDLRRFPSAKQFASFLGLTPSEQSSGETRNRGSITKAGNRRLRRMLVEAAWAYWRSPHISRELKKRSGGTSEAVRAITWKAQSRLHKRLRALQHRHVPAKKGLIAVTRELACAIWAVGQEEQLAA